MIDSLVRYNSITLLTMYNILSSTTIMSTTKRIHYEHHYHLLRTNTLSNQGWQSIIQHSIKKEGWSKSRSICIYALSLFCFWTSFYFYLVLSFSSLWKFIYSASVVVVVVSLCCSHIFFDNVVHFKLIVCIITTRALFFFYCSHIICLDAQNHCVPGFCVPYR